MDFIKKSIAYKTAASILAVFIAVTGIIGIYVYKLQTSIINNLQEEKKELILRFINDDARKTIRNIINNIKQTGNSIKSALTEALYNLDTDTEKKAVLPLLNNPNVVGVEVYDTNLNEVSLTGYKDYGGIVFDKKIPSDIKKYKHFLIDLKRDNEKIGYIKIYYDVKKAVKQVEEKKKVELTKFYISYQKTKETVNKKLFIELLIFILGGIIIIWLVIFLIKKFVNRPLKEFQEGLDSFFKFLKDPSYEVKFIKIKTEDEFGLMSKAVNESIRVSMEMHTQMVQLLNTLDKYVISVELDENFNITLVSSAYSKVSGFSKNELIGKNFEVLYNDCADEKIIEEMKDRLKRNESFKCEMKLNKKGGECFWVKFIISPQCEEMEHMCGYTAIMFDITDKKELEKLKNSLEILVDERTKELLSEKKLINSIVNSQESIVITTDGNELKTANRAFYEFFEINSIDEFYVKYGKCICDAFEDIDEPGYITKYTNNGDWIDYILKNPDKKFKVMIKKYHKPHIFTVSVDKFEFEGDTFITIVLTDITDLEMNKKLLEEMHKHMKDSIEFASLIQKAIIPAEDSLQKIVKDSFVIWEPKDIVGGDIWLFEILRNPDEMVLMAVDCTGHGVPGAFVTMIVKAIEREVVAKLKRNPDTDISPAEILQYFNKTMKVLLKQDSTESLSNAGFDGGIIYYDRRRQILKFAGAYTPLFYVKDGNVEMIKGNRYSVGYKKCDASYKYEETVLNVAEGMKFYLTTDGYLDQNGGEKCFPLGRRRFKRIIEKCFDKPMNVQKEIFYNELLKWQGNCERSDDITLIGFEIDKKSEIKKARVIEILSYEGIITQKIITTLLENLEKKIDNISLIGKLSTITIEMTQNIMKYAELKNTEELAQGFVEIRKIIEDDEFYEVVTKNIVTKDDLQKIESGLQKIKLMDKKEIRKKYRELRRSGEKMHDKGAGIGFYEIAKNATIDYEFIPEGENYYFVFKAVVGR